MLKNNAKSYGSMTKTFHWVMAIMIIGQIIVGYIMADMPESDPMRKTLFGLHKSFGFTLLILIILRLLWHVSDRMPPLPADMPKWQSMAARWNINFLYVLMVVLPISGLFMSVFSGYTVSFFGLFTIPAFTQKTFFGFLAHETHIYTGYIISACVVLHILAGVYHHFIRKDNVLKRMIVSVD